MPDPPFGWMALGGCYGCSAPPLRVGAFGDSTTAPRAGVWVYADQLAAAFAARDRSHEIFNAGVPGNTTAMGLARFQTDVLDLLPDTVIIQFGINDSMVDAWKYATEPRVSLLTYKANLKYFAQTLHSLGVRVIFMTPNSLRWTDPLRYFYARGSYPGRPDYPDSPYDPNDPRGICATLDPYAIVVRQVSAEESCPLVDVHAAFEAHPDTASLLGDGMHPNSAGHTIVLGGLLAGVPT